MSQIRQPKLGALDRGKVWAYFKYCDDNNHIDRKNASRGVERSTITTNTTISSSSGGAVSGISCSKSDTEGGHRSSQPLVRVRCILCNEELCNISTPNRTKDGDRIAPVTSLREATDASQQTPKFLESKLSSKQYQKQQPSNIIDTLWGHIKSKHPQLYSQLKNNNNNSSNYNNNNNDINNIARDSFNYDTKSSSKYDINHKQTESYGNRINSTTTTTKKMTPTKQRRELKNQRSNLDFIDYNDLSLTSMKPSPSSSLSSNLISRLTQLSSPVTRKLKFWNKKSFQVNQYDPSFKVIYLGNLGMQLWSKDESCLDKPLGTLWNNYLVNMKTEIVMRLTICNSGLKAITRQHGLTQYWSNRLVYCCSHKNYPRIFSWIYRHEGKKMRQELRCHAVLCSSPEKSIKMVTMLNQRLACALQEFRREKKSRGMTSMDNNLPSSQEKLPRTVPLRRQILAKGSANFRPPLERSKSAPKLTSILEEDCDSESLQSQEEFEYEQSFGERDDDDNDDEEESYTYEESSSSRVRDGADDGSHHYAETLNTSSSTKSDSITMRNGHNNSPKANGTITSLPQPPVESPMVNRSEDQLKFRQFTQSESQLQHQVNNIISITTKEENKFKTDFSAPHNTRKSSQDPINTPTTLSHNEDFNSVTSANMRSSSSLNQHHTTTNNGRSGLESENRKEVAKINNTSSNTSRITDNPSATEDVTQDIVSSWSNFVIK